MKDLITLINEMADTNPDITREDCRIHSMEFLEKLNKPSTSSKYTHLYKDKTQTELKTLAEKIIEKYIGNKV